MPLTHQGGKIWNFWKKIGAFWTLQQGKTPNIYITVGHKSPLTPLPVMCLPAPLMPLNAPAELHLPQFLGRWSAGREHGEAHSCPQGGSNPQCCLDNERAESRQLLSCPSAGVL